MNDTTEEGTSRPPRRSERRKQAARGPGAINTVTLVFVALKLTGQIDRSWWWVLSPQWISLAFVVVAILVVWVAAGLTNLACGVRA